MNVEEDYTDIKPRQILFNREAYYSQMRSAEILRVAKEMAEKSHQAALAAKKVYIAQYKHKKCTTKQNQRDS